MSWPDAFMPDPSFCQTVENTAIEAIENGIPAHYILPIGSPDLMGLIAATT